MKIKSILMSMLALAALASCNNDNEGIDGPSTPELDGPGAYLSVAINMPSSLSTRAALDDAGPGSDEGTTEESAVTDVYLLLYKGGIRVNELRPLGSDEYGTVGVGQIAAVAGKPIEVDPKVSEAFVVINPSTKVLDAIGANLYKSALTTAITENADDLKANGFMMTSDNGFVAVAPSVAADDSAEKIEEAKAAAKKNPVKIGVDRAVVKTKLNDFDGQEDVSNGTATVTGWKLNTTNKSYFPYAELIAYEKNGVVVTDAKYRIDPNYTGLGMGDDGTGAAIDAFNWLTNKKVVNWNTLGTGLEYCLENTMDAGAANQNYNNTTKMIIKATFTPTGIDAGGSWFRVGGVVMTFADLDASYVKASDTDKAKYSEFLDKLLGGTRTKGWTGEGKTDVVTLADLDAVANGGYMAATVTEGNYLIEYFQESLCYYDVNLKHDNRVEAFKLGRWGVVRNNAYTVNINKISQPGLPYIPDPTDPDITDPSNPNPKDPTPDDQTKAFISVSITVNNWTTWTQGVDL